MKHILLWLEELSLLVKYESPLKDTEDEPLSHKGMGSESFLALDEDMTF